MVAGEANRKSRKLFPLVISAENMEVYPCTLKIMRKKRSGIYTNRIYHRSLRQTEKSQTEGKQILPETRFIEFPALSVSLRMGFLGLRPRPKIHYFSYLLLQKSKFFI